MPARGAETEDPSPQTTAAPNDYLDFKAFQAFVQLLKRRTDVESIFSRCLAPGATGLTQEGWFTFMRTEQRVSCESRRFSVHVR